jgi:hypothetical protein
MPFINFQSRDLDAATRRRSVGITNLKDAETTV